MNIIPKNSVLLQDHMHGDLRWIAFVDPLHIVSAETSEEVGPALVAIEAYLSQGYYVAGYLAYEASHGIDSSLETHTKCNYPLLWFGVYRDFKEFDISVIEDRSFALGEWVPNISNAEYQDRIDQIKNHIRSGNTYQVNFTFRLRSSFSGDPLALAKTLFTAQSSAYCAYINLGNIHMCSASPELFFEHSDNTIVSRPMKGTVKRGVSSSEDQEKEFWLKNSIKNRAENVMIVDMIRNDMGRIAEPGSVRVDKLFSVERYPTVFQMTSTVSATTTCSSVDVLRNMYPCASITGAPKVKTMALIRELEIESRGIYTGSIGYFSPKKKAQFNVAIRTVVVDLKTSTAEYGVGGGVVWDSHAADEFNECKLKAQILNYREPRFELLESLLWTPSHGYMLLDRHLNRLEEAAQYFGFSCQRGDLLDKLHEATRGSRDTAKVRLTVEKSGKTMVSVEPVAGMIGKVVGLAETPVNTQSCFTYHKTTNRRIYTEALARHTNVNDLLLLNEQGRVTESCIGNLVVRKGTVFTTPDLSGGLLNGVFRAQLLEEKKITETVITPDDLFYADEIYLINSVRGWMKLETVEKGKKWRVLREFIFDFDEILASAGLSAESLA